MKPSSAAQPTYLPAPFPHTTACSGFSLLFLPKVAVGIAVALMRLHRGSLSRQTTLSAALVEAMSSREGSGVDEQAGPLVRDPWFQLVLCRECMLHGFYGAAEAGLGRLRAEGRGFEMSDLVAVWTEVLTKVSAAEAYYARVEDQASGNSKVYRFLGGRYSYRYMCVSARVACLLSAIVLDFSMKNWKD